MSKIKSVTDYWEEFFKDHPDPVDLRNLVSRDPILIKLFNFASVPSISINIKDYPFSQKINELDSISEQEREYFTGTRYHDHHDMEMLDYLAALFQVVAATVKLYAFLQENYKISQNELIEYVENAFHNYIAIDKTYEYQKSDGIQKWIRSVGRYFPIRLVRVVTTYDESLKSTRHLYQELFRLPPTEKEIEEIFNDLDRFSVISFLKYRPQMDKVCWGGFNPKLDGKKYSLLESNQFLMEFHYKGDRLPIYEDKNGKLYYQFNLAIRERYSPLLKSMVKKTIKKYWEKYVDEEDLLREEELKLYEKITKYDETKGDSPFKFIHSELRHFHQLKSNTTESKEFRTIRCNDECKKEKEYTEKLPCRFETFEGYCTAPVRNPKRRLKAAIEHTGGSLDEPIYEPLDKEVKTLRSELIEAPAFDIELELSKHQIQGQLDEDERRLYQDYYADECTQEKLAEKHGVHQSTIQRKIKKLEEKMKKII